MTRSKRYVVGLLLAGFLLALVTPLYLVRRAPHLSGYLLHPLILAGQTVPYLVCAALWLPWKARDAETAALILAAILLFAALVLYLPMLFAPRTPGGDMVGLAFILISTVTTGAVLLGSAIAGLVLWLRVRPHS
ncbi:MAG TPA: hypothetical protein VKP10_15240 [Gemmatimonadales bacterium]|nr:hypothetical protein [Gemmatimonadales bacterium]